MTLDSLFATSSEVKLIVCIEAPSSYFLHLTSSVLPDRQREAK